MFAARSVFLKTLSTARKASAALFSAAGGNFIARWDGSTWRALGSGTNSGVNALTVHNGELVAGGAFTTAGGVPATG